MMAWNDIRRGLSEPATMKKGRKGSLLEDFNVVVMGTSKKEVEKATEGDWMRAYGYKTKAVAKPTSIPYYYRVKVKRVL
jgi:hypothetical protein